MGYKQNLKSNLEYLMKQSDVTNEALAEHTGISRSSINRIRMGKGNPTVETLQTICNFFNVSIQEITEDVFIKGKHPVRSDSGLHREIIINNSKNIPVLDWDSLNSSREAGFFKNNVELYSVVTPQEYINIPKKSLLIFGINRKPMNGDIILVVEKQSGTINVVEYVQDIMTEHVRSCLPQARNQGDIRLHPLNNFKLLGVIIEARKIFIQI